MKICVTMGDPAGIGPEIILKAMPRFKKRKDVFIYASTDILKQTSRDLGLGKQYQAIRSRIVDCVEPVPFRYGAPDRATGRAAMRSLDQALASQPDILVTPPIVKDAVRRSRPNFTGHTEYLASFYGISQFGMLGLAQDKRILLVTTHLPLADALRHITSRRVLEKLILFDRELKKYFTILAPAIAVSALNPHAFEFSRGEDERILQAVIRARHRGINASGPFPADSLFNRRSDGFLAMYHDQAMIYLKARPDGLNVTLGLPVIRLSPLYGAALDIAGQGRARSSGLVAAVKAGIGMYDRRRGGSC